MKTNMNSGLSRIFRLVLAFITIFCFTKNGNSQLKEDWVARYNSFDKEDRASSLILDKEGSVYVTGFTTGKDDSKNILTIKYASSGKELWTAVYEGPENSDGKDAAGNSIALDQSGNVFVTGYTHGGVFGKDFCTIKYNSNGDQIWVRNFAGAGSLEDSDDEGKAIAADNDGAVIVTGISNGSGTGYDFFTVKYSSDGSQLWARSFNGQAGSDDIVKGIKIDSKNNVIIAGTSKGIIFNQDYCTVKYDADGNELWHAEYNGVGGNLSINEDEVSAMETDASGNIYVTGYSYGAETEKDFLTIKYDSEGNVNWISRINKENIQRGPAFNDEAKAIALDKDQNVYLTGITVSPSGNSDYYTVKLNSKGQKIWDRNFNSSDFGFSQDEAAAIATDVRGNVYVTGSVMKLGFERSCGSNMDFATIKYSSAGDFKWVKEYNGSGRFEYSDDIAKAIALDGKGGILIMGESMGDGIDMDLCLIKYSEYLIKAETADHINEMRLNDNYPNPFNPVTKISFEIPVSAFVKLAVYDISGREVALLENKFLQKGSHIYEWNASQFASGAYFYRIKTGSYDQTRKMLLIK